MVTGALLKELPDGALKIVRVQDPPKLKTSVIVQLDLHEPPGWRACDRCDKIRIRLTARFNEAQHVTLAFDVGHHLVKLIDQSQRRWV